MMTMKQIAEEYIRCFTDKSRVYMIENYLTTFDATQGREVRFNLFPKQKELIANFSLYPNNITTKPRQSGVTTTTAAFIACEIALARPERPETILTIANKLDMSKEMLLKIKTFLLSLPRWFWGEEYYGTPEKELKSIFITENSTNLVLFNGCKVHAKSSGKSAARGVSAVSWLIFDEAAFIENGIEVYSQAVATTSTGGHIVMISTPNGKDALYYTTFDKAKKGQNNYHITEFKWYQDPRYGKGLQWFKTDVNTGKTEVVNEIEFTYESLDSKIKDGWSPTSPWYVGMCNSLNNDSQQIAQEINVSFLGSSDTVIPAEVIEYHDKNHKRDPLFVDNREPATRIWQPAIEGHRYIMGIDASRGDSADSSVIQILDIDAVDEDGNKFIEQVLEYQGKMPGDNLGELAYDYGLQYNGALIVVDCIGGTGDACVLKLRDLGYPNLYYDDKNLKKTIIADDYKYTGMYRTEEKLPGFHTGSVRTQMILNFEKMLRENAIYIRSQRTIDEMNTWVFKNGRPDHMHGFHDDTLTCLAMTLYVFAFSFSTMVAMETKNRVMLKAWTTAGTIKEFSVETQERVKKIPLPFYSSSSLKTKVQSKSKPISFNQFLFKSLDR